MLPFNLIIIESYVKFFQFCVYNKSILILNIKAVLSEANYFKKWKYLAYYAKRNDWLLPVCQNKFFHSPEANMFFFAYILE